MSSSPSSPLLSNTNVATGLNVTERTGTTTPTPPSQPTTATAASTRQREEQFAGGQLYGLLVSYKDDEINERVHLALKGKKRVHYRCMDVYSNFLAFGTSVGAIYLFKLTTITHSSCKLTLVIPCDQGSIEVIKFIPGSNQNHNHNQYTQQHRAASELLIAIGTSRGSLVLFQLNALSDDNVMLHEIYRAEEFTKATSSESAIGIKLIEFDLELVPASYGQAPNPFPKIYICDQRNRMFVLESGNTNPPFRHRPAHVLSVDESTVHQVCVHKSQLLMSTDEKTRLFREQTNELCTIGKKQRKTKGFFGACFFNPNYKPTRMLAGPPLVGNGSGGGGGGVGGGMSRSRAQLAASQTTIYSSAASIFDMENLLIFVARPKFTLWQVNNRLEVMFTQIFDSSIRTTPPTRAIQLPNVPISQLNLDDPSDIELAFSNQAEQNHDQFQQQDSVDSGESRLLVSGPESDHFEKLIPIFSTTLGNLLLSYTKREIFVIDPTAARLIAWYCHDKPITQVCCNENEIYVLSGLNRRQIQVDRLILLAPTQFILELHRINRFNSLMVFVQLFHEQFRTLMALPLSGLNTITTEGGLLRNILCDTWREYCANNGIDTDYCKPQIENDDHQDDHTELESYENESAIVQYREGKFSLFKRIVDDIIDESKQLKQSIENIADSRLLFMMSNENVERLCSEPYASMVSLDISIANLHTNHVVHFSQEALQRHKSIAKLSQSFMNLNKLKRVATESSLTPDSATDKLQIFSLNPVNTVKPSTDRAIDAVIKKDSSINLNDKLAFNVINEDTQLTNAKPQANVLSRTRCSNCSWPKPRAHLRPMHHSQQIQYNYIQENLLPSFEENINLIEERAFKHGLWHLLLKCFAFENKLDDYIICCIMLDDVRLLNIERFIITRCSKDDLFDRVFTQLGRKLDLLRGTPNNASMSQDGVCTPLDASGQVRERCCFKCMNEFEPIEDNDDDDNEFFENPYTRQSEANDIGGEDDISFTLMNFFRRSMLRNNADIRRAVKILLKHPNLLNRSKIETIFYLQAIACQCAAIKRAIF